MSSWRTPAMAKARGPEMMAGVVVRSGMLVIVWWVVASPEPRTQTGGFLPSLARSALVMTTAPPASVTRQQSRRWKGYAIQRDESTSSMVIGSRIIAFGFSIAHLRVATAISASCSWVVPYWYIWRMQAIA